MHKNCIKVTLRGTLKSLIYFRSMKARKFIVKAGTLGRYSLFNSPLSNALVLRSVGYVTMFPLPSILLYLGTK